ncbi:FixH family protein [Croceimicrobium hydrocarbonivorans]|uniref:FixH family protein n=1 Tax=Croceimicrobium hydrocarbonivorans TaxID=2761580 RepID=A0A7H0VIK9_9FLAO|nr:FixH family protein [Croceimicrobium hydrocarbonivorans]QNR25557.1 FixH family protein [Croceimicrobium hydrocarbonivorans]
MKFNWGTGLVIVLALFILGMGTAVYKATQARHDLVTTEYYQEELAYQGTIDGKRNARELSGHCQLKVEDQKLILHFPEDLKDQSANLQVLMYFPTDAKKDFELKEENWKVGSYEVPGSKLGAGKWIAKIRLESGDKMYYFEPEIVL